MPSFERRKWQTVFSIETHFSIEILDEGCTHDIMKHRHLHTIAFEYCAFKKNSLGSIISEPLLRVRITNNNSYV